jgi:hypothetical protein
METGKTAKYFKYAIGEIVLVVIGILIALSINNWNEGRKVKEQEMSFILSIKEDLATDRLNLINIIEVQTQRYNYTDILLRELPNINIDNKTKLDSLFVELLYDNPTFFPTIGSYQSALASGKLNQFENNEIITKIINLYDSQFTRLVYNGDALDTRFFSLIENYKFERRTQQLRDMTPLQNIELQDDVNWYAGINDFYLRRCKETLFSINDILEIN